MKHGDGLKTPPLPSFYIDNHFQDVAAPSFSQPKVPAHIAGLLATPIVASVCPQLPSLLGVHHYSTLPTHLRFQWPALVPQGCESHRRWTSDGMREIAIPSTVPLATRSQPPPLSLFPISPPSQSPLSFPSLPSFPPFPHSLTLKSSCLFQVLNGLSEKGRGGCVAEEG